MPADNLTLQPHAAPDKPLSMMAQSLAVPVMHPCLVVKLPGHHMNAAAPHANTLPSRSVVDPSDDGPVHDITQVPDYPKLTLYLLMMQQEYLQDTNIILYQEPTFSRSNLPQHLFLTPKIPGIKTILPIPIDQLRTPPAN